MSEKRYKLGEKPFYSIQGEGRYAGVPSVWARVFGCNFQCPGFPCDTEYSWGKQYNSTVDSYTVEELINEFTNLVTTDTNPNGLMVHPITKNHIHVLFTGGEPLLAKYQKLIGEFIIAINTPEYKDRWFPLIPYYNNAELIDNRYSLNITIESNGSQHLTQEFMDIMDEYDNVNVLFSFSPKLKTVSGEPNGVNIANINAIIRDYIVQLKFVCDESNECEQELDSWVSQLYVGPYEEDILWVMPLGATREDQLQIAGIVEKYQAKGYRIATRNHTYIWSDAQGR
jgi:7-carboxy-7-deazaguanine synthase